MQSRDAINKIERQLNYECLKKKKERKESYLVLGVAGVIRARADVNVQLLD